MTRCDYANLIFKSNLEQKIYSLVTDGLGGDLEGAEDNKFRLDNQQSRELKEAIHYSIVYLLKERGTVSRGSRISKLNSSFEEICGPLSFSLKQWQKERILKVFELITEIVEGKKFHIPTKNIRHTSHRSLAGMDTPEAIYYYFYHLKFLDQESLRAVYLRQYELLQTQKKFFFGGVNKMLVTAREIIAPAIKSEADQMILVHNHPSGNTRPSEEDFKFTQTLSDLAAKLKINFLDHLIIGDYFFSFRQEGLL